MNFLADTTEYNQKLEPFLRIHKNKNNVNNNELHLEGTCLAFNVLLLTQKLQVTLIRV